MDSEWGDTWYWAFTAQSVGRLLRESMADCTLELEINGNVLASTAFLYGLAARELTEAELQAKDADYQLLITARVIKARGSA